MMRPDLSNASGSAPPIGLPRWLGATAAILFLVVASVYAYYVVFSRSMSLDEGYLMSTIRSFSEGNALYDSVFTQYGPFYYAYEWVVHVLASIPLTHDATRLLCVFHWLTASILLALAGGVLMRSVLGALFLFMQAVIHLAPLANEPGHPQELVAVLLALGMLAVARPPRRLRVVEVLAVITATLVFTKINVGIFFGFALLLALRCQATDRFTRGVWVWLLAGVCALLPFVLMRHHLAMEWCRNCGLIIASAVTTTLLLAHRFASVLPAPDAEKGSVVRVPKSPCGFGVSRGKESKSGAFARIAIFFLAPSVVIFGITLLTGTSVKGLLDGLLLTPLKMPGVALLPLPVSNLALANAAAALVLGLFVALNRQAARAGRTISMLKLVYGIAGTLCWAGNAKIQFAFLLPWVWLVLVPTDEGWERNPEARFARVFLCLATVWQSLQAYPIAGTQVTTATMLLIVTYTLCLSDCFHSLARFKQKSSNIHPRPWDRLHPLAPEPDRDRSPVAAPSNAKTWCKNGRVGGRSTALRPGTGRDPVRGEPEETVRSAPVDSHSGVSSVIAKYRSFAQALTITALLFLFANIWCRLPSVRQEYANLPSLDLPGSHLVHMDSETTEMYRALARYLQTECDTFVTYPGINSLYFWTGKRPPTHLNSTGWGQLSHPQQEQILTALRRAPRPMLVVVAAEAQRWANHTPPQIAPLVRCISEDCREVSRIGRFIIYIPRPEPGPAPAQIKHVAADVRRL